MDVASLTAKLLPRTTLVLSNVRDTIHEQPLQAPIGFVSMDLDLYSSTIDALQFLKRQRESRLRRVAMYFDDLSDHCNHRFAGELLAIDEFNAERGDVRIDRWRGLRDGRPFPEAAWLDAMYMAHDLVAIDHAQLSRTAARMR